MRSGVLVTTAARVSTTVSPANSGLPAAIVARRYVPARSFHRGRLRARWRSASRSSALRPGGSVPARSDCWTGDKPGSYSRKILEIFWGLGLGELRTSAASEPPERSGDRRGPRERRRKGSGDEVPRSRKISGLRGSNPSSWLGKPEHYHYAKPASRRAILTDPRKSAARLQSAARE